MRLSGRVCFEGVIEILLAVMAFENAFAATAFIRFVFVSRAFWKTTLSQGRFENFKFSINCVRDHLYALLRAIIVGFRWFLSCLILEKVGKSCHEMKKKF